MAHALVRPARPEDMERDRITIIKQFPPEYRQMVDHLEADLRNVGLLLTRWETHLGSRSVRLVVRRDALASDYVIPKPTFDAAAGNRPGERRLVFRIVKHFVAAFAIAERAAANRTNN
jgi:hypothetical protein